LIDALLAKLVPSPLYIAALVIPAFLLFLLACLLSREAPGTDTSWYTVSTAPVPCRRSYLQFTGWVDMVKLMWGMDLKFRFDRNITHGQKLC
jgi:hypothetical protein